MTGIRRIASSTVWGFLGVVLFVLLVADRVSAAEPQPRPPPSLPNPLSP